MKRKISIWTILVVLMHIIMPVHGNEKPLPALFREPTVYSPQVAALIRHDHIPVNLNTGGLDLNIPLVRWTDKEFDCPVSISYNSAGFRPREPDNYVGRNWMLNVGGVVYRQVNGVPDDIDDYLLPKHSESATTYYVNGFLSALNRGYFNLEEMNRTYQENPYKYTSRKDTEISQSTIPGLSIDVEPSADIFYFSFGKHSGKFMINLDGSVSVSGNNGGKYEVDLKNMKMFSSTKPQDTRIRILTDDGYVYTFGGNGYSSLEYNALSWESHFYNNPKNPPYSRNEITAYHLTEIQAPNGRKLTFSYRDIENKFHEKPQRLDSIKNQEVFRTKGLNLQYSLSGRSVFQEYRAAPHNAYLNNGAFEPAQKLYSLTKVALIDRISTDQCTIDFNYSARTQEIIYPGSNQQPGQFPYTCGAKLDEIVMCTSITEKARFSYIYQCGNRMFLDRVNTTREGNYTFQYNTHASAVPPNPLTYNIDHWGFWRGGKQNQGIVPATRPGTSYTQDYIMTSDDRNPTGDSYNCTLLQRVNYPTGGSSVFEYEPHRYSRIAQQIHSSSYYTDLGYPLGKQDDIAGGARVKSITYFNGKYAAKKTIYTYGYTLLMGELMYMPYYKYMAMKANPDKTDQIISLGFDSEGITDRPYPSVHVRYPEVTEHYVDPSAKDLSKKHPYKTVHFIGYTTSMRHYSDDFVFPTYTTANPILRPEHYFAYPDIEKYNKNLLAHPTVDASLQYGKIQKESLYNLDGQLVQETEYEYTYLNKEKKSLRIYTPAPHFGLQTGLYTHIAKEPFYDFGLVKKKISVFSPGNTYTRQHSSEWYTYDNYNYLTQKASLKTNGDSLITRYEYKNVRGNDGMQVLPTTQSTYMVPPSGRHLLGKQIMEYRRHPSVAGRKNYWYVPISSASYANDGQLVSMKECTRYDNFGNIIEWVQNGSTKHTIYLWGYHGQHLVARIENTTYSEVRKALGNAPENLSGSYSYHPSIATLRAKLPKAQVYTYSYEDGVGMSSQTAPNGQTTSYTYDLKGRLEQTCRTGENGKQEILQLNKYHIINE